MAHLVDIRIEALVLEMHDIMEVGEMDLSDPDVRFGALLQLRLLPTDTR